MADREVFVDLTDDVFGPDGYVQEELAVQSRRFRIYSTDDERFFAFRTTGVEPKLLHAVYYGPAGWLCGCGATASAPCIAVALLQVRDAVQEGKP